MPSTKRALAASLLAGLGAGAKQYGKQEQAEASRAADLKAWETKQKADALIDRGMEQTEDGDIQPIKNWPAPVKKPTPEPRKSQYEQQMDRYTGLGTKGVRGPKEQMEFDYLSRKYGEPTSKGTSRSSSNNDDWKKKISGYR